jgi:hypothetical protein
MLSVPNLYFPNRHNYRHLSYPGILKSTRVYCLLINRHLTGENIGSCYCIPRWHDMISQHILTGAREGIVHMGMNVLAYFVQEVRSADS